MLFFPSAFLELCSHIRLENEYPWENSSVLPMRFLVGECADVCVCVFICVCVFLNVIMEDMLWVVYELLIINCVR